MIEEIKNYKIPNEVEYKNKLVEEIFQIATKNGNKASMVSIKEGTETFLISNLSGQVFNLTKESKEYKHINDELVDAKYREWSEWKIRNLEEYEN